MANFLMIRPRGVCALQDLISLHSTLVTALNLCCVGIRCQPGASPLKPRSSVTVNSPHSIIHVHERDARMMRLLTFLVVAAGAAAIDRRLVLYGIEF